MRIKRDLENQISKKKNIFKNKQLNSLSYSNAPTALNFCWDLGLETSASFSYFQLTTTNRIKNKEFHNENTIQTVKQNINNFKRIDQFEYLKVAFIND